MPVKLYPAQLDILRRIWSGEDVINLKARQLGITTAYALRHAYLLNFRENYLLNVFSQSKFYAQQYLRNKVDPILSSQPEWMRRVKRKSDDGEVSVREYGSGNQRTMVYAMAATEKSGRSESPDEVLFDEAGYADDFMDAFMAIGPGIASTQGRTSVISTSNGPQGDFFNLFQDAKTGKNLMTPIFYPWFMRPGRDDAFYESERKRLKSDPIRFRREYPTDEEDAWLQRTGAVLPHFSREKHVLTWEQMAGANSKPFKESAQLYRGIDWGHVDPFAVLWIAHFPHKKKGFAVHPDCVNLIREMSVWAHMENGKPDDKRNCHAIDALRYTLKGIRPDTSKPDGFIYVYREMYEPNARDRGLSLTWFQNNIKVRSVNEQIQYTYCDPSRGDLGREFSDAGIPTTPAPRIREDARVGLIEEGVNALNDFLTQEMPVIIDVAQDLRRQRLDEIQGHVRKGHRIGAEDAAELLVNQLFTAPTKVNRVYQFGSKR